MRVIITNQLIIGIVLCASLTFPSAAVMSFSEIVSIPCVLRVDSACVLPLSFRVPFVIRSFFSHRCLFISIGSVPVFAGPGGATHMGRQRALCFCVRGLLPLPHRRRVRPHRCAVLCCGGAFVGGNCVVRPQGGRTQRLTGVQRPVWWWWWWWWRGVYV